VHQTLAVEAYRSSVEMARERGAFPIYDAKREEGNPFIARIAATDPDLYDRHEKVWAQKHCVAHCGTNRNY
jgi:ribonucleoside-diphosphate reductase alpha chain